MTQTLRPYQVDAVTKAIYSLHKYNKTLLVMATGLGKTTVFAELIRLLNTRTLVIAHRKELIEQAEKRLNDHLGTRVGVEMASRRSRNEQVVVASIQTLAARGVECVGPRDLIVIDEAHHAVSDTYLQVLARFPNAKILGVTATPDRTDGVALGSIFKHVAFRYETRQAIRDGWLVPIIPKTAYGLGQLIRMVGNRQTIIFTPDVAKAIQLSTELPSCRYVHGAMNKTARGQVINGFKNNDFQYIANCNVLTEGFDHPATGCVAMLRTLESRSMFVQQLGRGLRLADDKTDCLYVDLTMNMPDHDLEAPRDALGGEQIATPTRGVIESVWQWFA